MNGLTFQPILPGFALLAVASVILGLRVFTLYQLLVRKTGGSLKRMLLRWGALTLAILCVFVAAFRPGADHTRVSAQKPPAVSAPSDDPALNVFLMVDRSLNSWVDDLGPQNDQYRMVGIRADLNAIVDQFPHANFSIIAFGTSAAVDWPLSADVWGLKALLKDYSAYNAPGDALAQTDPTAGGDLLNQGLAVARAQYPKAKNLVFYLGEGRRGDAVKPGAFAVPAGLVGGGAVLGYGTPAGGQVPDHWDESGQMAYAQGPNGPVVAAPDEMALRQIAAQLAVPYFHRNLGDPVAPVITAIPVAAAGATSPMVKRTDRTEFYWVFAMIAAALLAIEVFVLVREFRRNRAVKVT